MRSKAHGLSVLLGKSWSYLVNESTGFSFGQTAKESLAVQRGISRTDTETEQSGRTATSGHDSKITDGSGNSFVRTEGQVGYHSIGGEERSSSTAMGQLQNTARSLGESYSTAIQDLRSTAHAVGRSLGVSAGHERGSSSGSQTSRTTGQTTGSSSSETVSDTDTISQARAKLRGFSLATGKSLGITRSHEVALARSFQELLQFSQSFGRALQETASRTETQGEIETEGISFGASEAKATGTTETHTVAERKEFFSLEGEREITVNDLQKLPRQCCVVAAKEALAAVEIETYRIPEGYYPYQNANLPAEILSRQRRRLQPEKASMPVPVLALPQSEQIGNRENSPWEF